MTEELTYIDIGVREPQKAIAFLTQYLGFAINRNPDQAEKAGRHGWLISNNFGNSYFIGSCENDLSPGKPIVINTDDCLRDYYRLDKTGIKFDGTPGYTTLGLAAVVVDENYNKYTLLEKRDYTDEL